MSSGPLDVFARRRPYVGTFAAYDWPSFRLLSPLAVVLTLVELEAFPCFFRLLNMSRIPLIPIRELRLFLVTGVVSGGAAPLSSLGKVTVLLIASPHRQSRLTLSLLSLRSGTAVKGLSISRRSKSWRWLRSFLPVDARHDAGIAVGKCVPGGGVGVAVSRSRSSPSNVMARSRLLLLEPGSLADVVTAGADTLVVGGAVAPPPSSMRSSAHSHAMRYLESIA